MMWVTPICDRTDNDIKLKTAKSFCNAADLNRLEDNCKEVAAIFGVALSLRSSRWAATDLPTASELDRILWNIRLIYGQYTAYLTTPKPPASPLTHWQKWNDAERILLDIRSNYIDNRTARCCCGELISGERSGIL